MIAAKAKMRPIMVTNSAGRTRPSGDPAPTASFRNPTADDSWLHCEGFARCHTDLDLGRQQAPEVEIRVLAPGESLTMQP